MFKEFKEFAMKGNVIDMAVGIIIGAAFGTIIKSLVDDVLMPPIGLLLGNVDFSNLFLVIKEGKVAGPVCQPRCGQGCRSSHGQHRRLHQYDHQLSHCCVFGLSGHQERKQIQERATTTRPDYKGLPALFYGNSCQGNTVSSLYI